MTKTIRIVLRLPLPLNRAVRLAATRQGQSINRYTQAALVQWLQLGRPARRPRRSE